MARSSRRDNILNSARLRLVQDLNQERFGSKRAEAGPSGGDRMTESSYGQFCPVAMAAEILCTRWTVVVLRELMAGSSRFNDLRRGVPRMSPALLSLRLKELE